MTSPPPEPTDRAAAAAPARNVKERALVFVVAFLGLLILTGLAAVVARIIYLASEPAAQRATANGAAARGGTHPAAIRLDLPAGAVVKSTSVSGDRLAVYYEAAGRSGIAVLDLSTGAVVRHVDVLPGGGR